MTKPRDENRSDESKVKREERRDVVRETEKERAKTKCTCVDHRGRKVSWMEHALDCPEYVKPAVLMTEDANEECEQAKQSFIDVTVEALQTNWHKNNKEDQLQATEKIKKALLFLRDQLRTTFDHEASEYSDAESRYSNEYGKSDDSNATPLSPSSIAEAAANQKKREARRSQSQARIAETAANFQKATKFT